MVSQSSFLTSASRSSPSGTMTAVPSTLICELGVGNHQLIDTCGVLGVIWVALVERTSVVETKIGVDEPEDELGRWSWRWTIDRVVGVPEEVSVERACAVEERGGNRRDEAVVSGCPKIGRAHV